MANTSTNRGKNPTEKVKLELYARSAGRCQFEGCNKDVFYEEQTAEKNNFSNIAHIVASSPEGPRGDVVRSHQLSDKLENLMVLCFDHHKIVDSQPEKYTEEVLLEMKRKQEEMISEACEFYYKKPTEIIMLQSPIKGRIDANVDFDQAVQAIIKERKPASNHGIRIKFESDFSYRDRDYWKAAEVRLKKSFTNRILPILEETNDLHFSVFPLAPIPMIIELGYLLGDKVNIDVFQKTRTPDTWNWMKNEQTNKFVSTCDVKNPQGKNIALVFSLTSKIDKSRIYDVLDADSIYEISSEKHGVDCIASLSDLSALWHVYQETCEKIVHQHGTDCNLSIFPSMPVSAAFEVGRRFMEGVYPMMRIYDEDGGFFETITIGGSR